MDNAVTQTVPTPLVPAAPGVAARWRALPARTQTLALLGLAALAVVLVALWAGARDGEWRVLFPNLSRMKLAAAGLNVGSGSTAPGYELLDKNSFGQTQGQERMKMQRAIEGELTTTIQSLESVRSARVHLALPQMNGFFREQQKPSASVVLTLHNGRTLDRNQIAGIVRVVSGSVPELSARAVSVVDSSGALLSAPGDDETAQGLDSQQLQYRREVEAGHLTRVLALLEPVVGRDNVRASVSACLNSGAAWASLTF